MTEGYGYSPPIEESTERFYIRDTRQYVGNCLLWWAKGSSGYTTDLDEAGQYSKEEAEKICKNRDTDVMYPVESTDEIAERHVDHQKMPKEKSNERKG